MPFLTGDATTPGVLGAVVAATPGLRVTAYAPADFDDRGMPTPSVVVAWALVTDPDSAGGARVDPVFLAGGRTWTPDQFRAAYGGTLQMKVVAG